MEKNMRRLLTIALLLILLTGCAGSNIPADTEYLGSLPVNLVMVDDTELGYRVFGKGTPLLLIMGFAGTMDIWDTRFIRQLAEEHTVIIFDNRGMGESSAGNRTISIAGMARDAAGILDALGYERAHILGWSMGGLIAQELTISRPEKVNKLILMGTSCENKAVAEITNELMRMDTKTLLTHIFPGNWLDEHPGAIAGLPRQKKSPDPRIVKAQAEAMIKWQGCCDRLRQVQNETLIISGTDDDILPQDLSMHIAGQIEGSWLARYRNAAHWLMYQDPLSLALTINNFLLVNENMMKDQQQFK